MSKTRSYHFSSYKPTKKERDLLAAAPFRNIRKLIYKPLKNGKFKTYCFNCDTYETVKADELKQIKASRLCPTCHAQVSTGVKLEQTEYAYVGFEKGDTDYGFRLTTQWQFNKKPRLISCEHVMLREGNENYRHNVVKGMGWCLCNTMMKDWRKCTSDYWGYFISTDNKYNYGYYKPITKKQYYERELKEVNHLIKSNQRKLIEDNLLNANQVAYMMAFNLNSIEQILRYASYMKKYDITYYLEADDINMGLNEYYLKYLKRNKIDVRNYFDYIAQCKTLGFKLDKPKDFQAKHEKYSQIIKYKENMKYQQGISKIYHQLKERSYSSRKYSIRPFKEVKEIIDCGDKLHNCIAQYISKYAKQRTTLWRMDIDGELTVAIEVRAGILIQARTIYNQSCNSNQKRVINKWLKDNYWVNSYD